MMKRNSWIMTGAAMLVITTALSRTASANDTVTLYTNSNSDYVSQLGGYGGEFTAITGDYSLPTTDGATVGEAELKSLGYVANTISTAGSTSEYGFDTFCIQQTVTYHAGTQYYYSTSDTFTPDGPLSAGVAWLYEQFATGVLSGYAYTTGSRPTSSAELQSAIWYLQGETPYNGYTTSTISSDPFIVDVVSQFGTLTKAEAADAAGGYDVAVMDLTSGNNGTGTAEQDQLILIPGGQGSGSVPDGGTTVCFLGLVFAALAFLRHRLSKLPA
jgi:hypothetical protein